MQSNKADPNRKGCWRSVTYTINVNKSFLPINYAPIKITELYEAIKLKHRTVELEVRHQEAIEALKAENKMLSERNRYLTEMYVHDLQATQNQNLK